MGDFEKLDCTTLHRLLDEVALELHNDFSYECSSYSYGSTGVKRTDGFLRLRKRFNEIFILLFNNSLLENYSWQFCPFIVYESFFEQRKLMFFQQHEDVTIKDFCSKELLDFNASSFPKSLYMTPQMRYKFNYNDTNYQFQLIILETEIHDKIYFSQRQRIDFLKNLMNGKHRLSISEIEKVPEIFFDFSDSSGAEKIVFLYELGVLDFLFKTLPFSTSINKLAQVISAFTGIKQTTAQSYLNPIFSIGVDQAKSPLSEKNIKSVTEKLMKMGYIKK